MLTLALHKIKGRVRTNPIWQRSLRAYGRARKRVRDDNFLILGSARCGTTLLVDYLNCHPQVRCRGEILGIGHWQYGNPFRMGHDRLRLHLESFFVKRPGLHHGAKILTFHLDELPIKLSDCLEILGDPQIIVIYREQLLEQFLSLRTAERSGIWHVQAPWEGSPTWLDPTEFQGFCERERRMWDDNAQALNQSRVHYLRYEDLAGAPEASVRNIFDFLDLAPCPVSSRLVKQNRQPVSERLANYRQFVKLGILGNAVLRLSPASRQRASQPSPWARAA